MEYRFIIEDQTGQFSSDGGGIASGAINVLGSGANEAADSFKTGNLSRTFAEGAAQKATNIAISKTILSPLSQAPVVGGLVSPAYKVMRSVAKSGWGSAAVAGGLVGLGVTAAIMGIEAIIAAHQRKIARLENEAQQANSRDEALIRAGRIDIYGKTVSFDKYGRMKLDRS